MKLGEHSMAGKDKLSVIICTKDRSEDAIQCIQSILIQTRLPDEIVIIDSSSTHELKAKLDSLSNPNGIAFEYIHAEAHLTKARNIGIDNSIGDIIMFLDDDLVLRHDNYIEEIMHVFEGSLGWKLGGVSGKVLSPDSERRSRSFRQLLGHYYLQILGAMFFLFKFGDGKFQPSGFPTSVSRDVTKTTPVESLSGGNMSFRRELISQFRFDEITPFGEDDDIAYRVSREYQNVYVPQGEVIHKAALRGGAGYRPSRMKQEIEAYYYHFKKNIPQTPMHRFAFYWSMIGRLINEVVIAIIRGDTTALRSFLSGVVSMKAGGRELLMRHYQEMQGE